MWTNQEVKMAIEDGGIGTFGLREILSALLLRIEVLESQVRRNNGNDSLVCICEKDVNPTDYRGYCCECGKPR